MDVMNQPPALGVTAFVLSPVSGRLRRRQAPALALSAIDGPATDAISVA